MFRPQYYHHVRNLHYSNRHLYYFKFKLYPKNVTGFVLTNGMNPVQAKLSLLLSDNFQNQFTRLVKENDLFVFSGINENTSTIHDIWVPCTTTTDVLKHSLLYKTNQDFESGNHIYYYTNNK